MINIILTGGPLDGKQLTLAGGCKYSVSVGGKQVTYKIDWLHVFPDKSEIFTASQII